MFIIVTGIAFSSTKMVIIITMKGIIVTVLVHTVRYLKTFLKKILVQKVNFDTKIYRKRTYLKMAKIIFLQCS